MTNPLLNPGILPNFTQIKPELIEPAVREVIQQNRKHLDSLLSQKSYSWENLIQPLEEDHDRLSKIWAPISHLHSVMESEALREAYNKCIPLLTEYHTEIMQNKKLHQAIQAIKASADYQSFNPAQQKIIANDLRDFRLAGVHLPANEKAQFAELQKKLSQLTTKFSENLLDATQAWVLEIQDSAQLKGLPEQAIQMAKEDAIRLKKQGYVLTLEYPSFSAAIKYLADRELRKRIYTAYVTRASDQGPNANQFDNTPIIEEICRVRHALANLVGFANYAEYSLATKMAATPKTVLTFLNDLVAKSKSIGEKDIAELEAFAKQDKIERLEAWDLPYYSEKLRESKYALSQEELRAYFPIDQVLAGMFTVVNKIFGIQIVERFDVDTWHPQVQFFDIFDEQKNYLGSFYTDLYARPHKRDGAWMDECRVRRRLSDGMQHPVAFLTCNFSRPMGGKPALLTHDEVVTLFHEFGHCLHHLLTKVDYAAVSGINGVLWDAVEFPSQMMEYWCYEKPVLDLISSHYQTKEKLPQNLFDSMQKAKNFQPGLHMLRQLEFSLFDFRLHLEFDRNQSHQAQTMIDEVRKSVAVVHIPSFNRFQQSFSHIFAGSYAAGYYSYKWAEVLSADAFSYFKERDVFDPVIGESFVTNILQQGGVGDPMKLFVAFRGREPKIDALLKYSGLSEE